MELLALPEEMLTAILQSVIDNPVRPLKLDKVFQLKRLRLTCKAFASNHAVMKTLFRGLIFKPDRDSRHNLSDSELARLAPHVRRVTFVLYEAMRLHGFDEVMSLLGEPWTTQRQTLVNSGRYELVKRMYDDLLHASDWLAMRNDSNRHATAYEWVRVLKQLPQCHCFRLHTDYDVWHDLMSLELVQEEFMIAKYIISLTQSGKDMVGDDLWLATSCLMAAQVSTHHLNIDTELFPGSSLQSALENHHLNLTGLVRFKFRPQFDDPQDRSSAWHQKQQKDLNNCVQWVLWRCNLTIQVLECTFRGYVDLVATPVPLPRLKTLDLTSVRVSDQYMLKLLGCAPKLEELALNSVQVSNESGMAWRKIFEAIRSFPNISKVDLKYLSVDEQGPHFLIYSWSKSSGTGLVQLNGGQVAELYDPDDVGTMLTQYLDGKVEWDGTGKEEWQDDLEEVFSTSY